MRFFLDKCIICLHEMKNKESHITYTRSTSPSEPGQAHKHIPSFERRKEKVSRGILSVNSFGASANEGLY